MEENVIQINGGITTNVDVSVKKRHVCENGYIWNPDTCSCENGKYLASNMDNSAIICDKGIESEEETKTVPANLMKRKLPVKHKISIFYLHFC